MNGVQQCQWEPRKVEELATNPGLAARWFGMDEAAIEAACGRYKKGRNAGKLRGWIVYQKVRVGGWSYGRQCVFKPGLIFARFCKTWEERNDAISPPPRADFLTGAVRVDTCYGHDPLKALADRKAADERFAAEAAERASLEADEGLRAEKARDRLHDALEGVEAWEAVDVRLRNAVVKQMALGMAKAPIDQWDAIIKWVVSEPPGHFQALAPQGA